MNTFPSHIAAASRIDDLDREAERRTLALQARRQARAAAPPYPVRRALGWWLVSAGLRLAHPKPRHHVALR